MRTARGVPGEDACVTCFEEDCGGCRVLAPVPEPDPEHEGHTFEFDPETHTYRVDGQIVPGVTELASIMGDPMPAEGDDLEITVEAAAERGTVMHGYLEHRIWGGEPQDCEIPDAYAGYAQAVELFLAEHKLDPVYVEEPMWAEEDGIVFAGTPDFVGTFDGKLAILDWKFVSTVQKTKVGAQLSGYHALCGAEELWAERLACVQFLADGTYRLYNVSLNVGDFDLCLEVWRSKHKKHPRGGII